MTTRIHAIVYGTVQGVFFRSSTQQEARKRNLTGWVRNLPDGSVELEAQGQSSAVDTLMEWLWHGPPDASVRRVSSETISLMEGEGTFEVRR